MDIGRSFQQAMDGIIGFLPNLIGFLVILLVGYIVAKVVQAVLRKILQKVGLDRKLHESDANRYVERVMPGASPANGVARVVFWLIFVFFLFSAIGALGIPALTSFMNQVLAYLPNVIAAILIFVLAAIIAGAVGAGVGKLLGDTPTGKIVATIVPALVMVIAMFMILEQLKIAESIVQIAFAATMGALALGLALAFGLGGRGVAERMLEDAYRKGQENKDQVKQDMRTGRERAETQAREQKDRLDPDSGTSGDTTSTYTGTTGAYSDPGTAGAHTDPATGAGYADPGTTGGAHRP